MIDRRPFTGNSKLKILLVSQSAHPDVSATAQLTWDLAKYLQKKGHLVTLIASRSLYGSCGAVLPSREQIDGVNLIRVGASLFGKASIIARAMDFGLFYLCIAFRVFFLPRQDVSVWLSTPPFIALLGWLLRVVRGTPFVYWLMDLYPDVAVACGVLRVNGIAAKLLDSLNRFCLRAADHVVVLGRCMEAMIVDKGIPKDRITSINVWSAADTVAEEPGAGGDYRQAWGVGDRLLVMYAGNFGLGHDMLTIAASVVELAKDPRIVFAFVGSGKRKAELLQAVSAGESSQVIDAPFQPRELLGKLLGSADVHLISMSAEVKGMLVPSKLYGVLAAGKPALFVGPADSEVGLVISESGCGTTVANGDEAGLTAAIRAYANERERVVREGVNGQNAYAARWNALAAMARWEALLEAVGRGSSSADSAEA